MELDFEQFFRELTSAQIEFVVIGGLAVNLHGIPRMTYDIDLMIRLEQNNILKTVTKLMDLGYAPRLPVKAEDLAKTETRDRWIREKNLKAFTFQSQDQPIGEIDLLIDCPKPYDEIRKRAVIYDIGSVKIPVISVPDLIELKTGSGRKQDLSDIEHLRRLL